MAAPVVAASSNGVTSSASRVHTITLPTGISAGHLLLVMFTNESDDPVEIWEAQSGAKWRMLGTHNPSTTQMSTWVYWKIAEGSDALTLRTRNQSQSTHIAYRITGHASNVRGASAGGNSTNPNPPARTITGSAQDVLWVAYCGVNSANTSAGPSGYSGYEKKTSTGVPSTNVAYTTSNATSEDPGVFTCSSSYWAAWTIAVPSAEITSSTGRLSQIAVEVLSSSAVSSTARRSRQISINC